MCRQGWGLKPAAFLQSAAEKSLCGHTLSPRTERREVRAAGNVRASLFLGSCTDLIACALCEPWKSASSSHPPELCPAREGAGARQHGLLGTSAALGMARGQRFAMGAMAGGEEVPRVPWLPGGWGMGRAIESFRSEKTSRITEFNHQATPRPPSHVPQCHISTPAALAQALQMTASFLLPPCSSPAPIHTVLSTVGREHPLARPLLLLLFTSFLPLQALMPVSPTSAITSWVTVQTTRACGSKARNCWGLDRLQAREVLKLSRKRPCIQTPGGANAGSSSKTCTAPIPQGLPQGPGTFRLLCQAPAHSTQFTPENLGPCTPSASVGCMPRSS